MSKGIIRKTGIKETPSGSLEKVLHDMVLKLLESCEVHTEDGEWQDAIQRMKKTIQDHEKQLDSERGKVSREIQRIQLQLDELKKRKIAEIKVNLNGTKLIDLGLQHSQFEQLLKMCSTGLNIFLVGPTGSGKTTAAISLAKALGVEFHFTGAIASEYKLTGFINAQGEIVSTEFRKAYEHGGLFLFDEIDASYPQAVLAFNAALSNNYMDFPDRRVKRHKDFYCIAAANTFGQGADRQYVGRNQMDAASLDRFVFLEWKYDEKLEMEIASNEEWTNYVQQVRKIVEDLKIRHVVSPRASISGAKLIQQGFDREFIEQSCLWKGMDQVTINKIKSNLNK